MNMDTVEMPVGNAEIPVDNVGQDQLGLSAYSDSLAAFIKNCVTPTTIAVQGDWGSGKTSLLHMIRSTLNPSVSASAENTNKEANGDYLCIDFNTWQYSQFEMSDSLSITFLTCFLYALQEKLGKSQKLSGTMDTIKKVTAGFAKRAALYTVGKFGGDELKDAAEEALGTISGDTPTDEIDLTKQLKEQISDCIDEVIKSGKKRIVVFIDDLDRLNPVRAVELLEIIKIFLDCPHCVYVLAVDTNVIKQGIVQKYGLSEEKSHAFFEKLIQVPFIMPIAYYRFDAFARSIFPSDGDLNYQTDFFDKLSHDDREHCITLLSLASDKNPRAAKRIINSFVLLDMVNRKNQPIPSTKVEADKYRAEAKLLLALTCIQIKLEPDYRAIIDMAAFSKRFTRWLESNDLLIPEEQELHRKYNYSQEQVDNYVRTKISCCRMITIFKEWCRDFNKLHGDDGKALQALLQSTNEKEQKNAGNYSLLARTILNEFENTFRDIRRKVILNCLEQQKDDEDYCLWYDEAVKLLTSRPEKTTHLSSQEMLDKITLLIQSVDLEREDVEKVTPILDLYESLDSVKFHYTYTNMMEESFLQSVGDHLCTKYRAYKRAEANINRYLQVQDIFSLSPEYNIGFAPSRLSTAMGSLKLLYELLRNVLDANEELNDVYTQLSERILYFYIGMRVFHKGKRFVATSTPLPSLFTFALMSEGDEDARAFEKMEEVLLGKGDARDYRVKTPTVAGNFKDNDYNMIREDLYKKINVIQIDAKQCLRIYEKVKQLLPFDHDKTFDDSFGWLKEQSKDIKERLEAVDGSKPDKETLTAYGKQRMKLLFGIASALAYLGTQEQYQTDISTFRQEADPDFNCIFRAVDIIEQEYFAGATDGSLKNPAIFQGVSQEALDELRLALDSKNGWQFDNLPDDYQELTLGMVREFLNQPEDWGSYELGMLIGRHFDENATPRGIIFYETELKDGTKTIFSDYCCFEKRENTFLWKYYEVFVKVINLLRVHNSDLQEMFSGQTIVYDRNDHAGILGADTDLTGSGMDDVQYYIRNTISNILHPGNHKPGTPLSFDMDLAKQVKSILENIHSDVLNKLFETEFVYEVISRTSRDVIDYFKAMGELIYHEIPQFMKFIETGSLNTADEDDKADKVDEDDKFYTEVFEHMNPHHRKFWEKYSEILEQLRILADGSTH